MGENTKDAVYIDAERRFQELEEETKKLHSESKKYFDAINGMLSHQMEFSKAIAEIYLVVYQIQTPLLLKEIPRAYKRARNTKIS
jgi:hypothetical protein